MTAGARERAEELYEQLAKYCVDGYIDEQAATHAIAEALSRARTEAIAEAVKVAEDYMQRMEQAALKPHPLTGKENTVALCKADAGMSIAQAIGRLKG